MVDPGIADPAAKGRVTEREARRIRVRIGDTDLDPPQRELVRSGRLKLAEVPFDTRADLVHAPVAKKTADRVPGEVRLERGRRAVIEEVVAIERDPQGIAVAPDHRPDMPVPERDADSPLAWRNGPYKVVFSESRFRVIAPL